MVIMAAMGGFGAKLVEISTLDHLQGIGDAVKLGVLRCVFPDPAWGALAVGIEDFEARAIPLAPEASEPDARLPSGAAAHQPDGSGLEVQPEDFGDALEILIDGIVPVMVEATQTFPPSVIMDAR
ncbi:hypothetical protein GCM10007291_02010 [Gemmobacter nanjingensis]|uniref:Uncharacterized protein n=1 Tax=Gemmobacter nanjingensis TaxID=488454 RepID=A0ABQ3F6E9_9RHOB|nr:hypothetical protein GCM10007291_02010 [Gemmobacter nanjingensis]